MLTRYLFTVLAATFIACSSSDPNIHNDCNNNASGHGGSQAQLRTGGNGGSGGAMDIDAGFDASCGLQTCPFGWIDVCPALTKTYCCGSTPSGFAPVCEVDAGLVTVVCPAQSSDGGKCIAPCAIDTHGNAECGIALDGG